ncbi:hypothetical protein HanIR_Chr09g0395841 [Helianthus annuus]|nr:hypothetical protein HanIR_Chr09g0395841 [Helianthus annuus]
MYAKNGYAFKQNGDPICVNKSRSFFMFCATSSLKTHDDGGYELAKTACECAVVI